MGRYLGVDLHRNCFTVCTIEEGGRSYLREWRLKDLGRFVLQLRGRDEVAVEVTGNTRLFYDAVVGKVSRVVVVNPNEFPARLPADGSKAGWSGGKVISQSVQDG